MSSAAPLPIPLASQLHCGPSTPMGASLTAGGATFRIWAPAALEVHVIAGGSRQRLTRNDDSTWTGFVPGVTHGTGYRFHVTGEGSQGLKRDSWARELAATGFPDCDCIAYDPDSYPWHDAGFHAPPFHDLILYQLHVGVFYGVDARGNDVRDHVAKFLDVAGRIPYLRELGVTAVQLLPVQEFPYDNSLGYNNVDFFSPEMAYHVEDSTELNRHLRQVNALLAEKGQPPLTAAQLSAGPNQLKVLVDLLHLNGIAVIFDLVYNHAGGGFDDQSLYFFDRRKNGNNNNSLYFTDQGWAGGLVFAYWNPGVRDFLIRNGEFFLTGYHIDGIRYDEVSVIDNHGGWFFCQDLTSTLRYVKPQAIQIAEYWNPSRELAVKPPPAGMGFDAALADGLREALRGALESASHGAGTFVNLDRVRDALYPPYGFGDAWRAVNCLENHDLVYSNREPHDWKPRIARLADPSNPRSWYARSRARWATSLLVTAPGIPMLFMGQEILEDKNWNDSPEFHHDTLIWWDGLGQDSAMHDFLGFAQALIRLRRDHEALRGPNLNAYHVNNAARVIAFHRWMDGTGQDIVVAGTLSEGNLYDYEIGFPQGGEWREVFNSDFYESAPDHRTTGNGGSVHAQGGPLHGMPASAKITLPANGVVVFAR